MAPSAGDLSALRIVVKRKSTRHSAPLRVSSVSIVTRSRSGRTSRREQDDAVSRVAAASSRTDFFIFLWISGCSTRVKIVKKG